MTTSFQSFISFCSSTCVSVAALTIIASSATAQQATPRVPFAKPQAVPPAAVPPRRRVPEITQKAKHGSWIIRCQKQKVPVNLKPKPAAKKSSKGDRGNKTAAKPAVKVVEICLMSQQVKPVGNSRNVAMHVSVLKGKTRGKDFKLLRIVVPEGVYLPAGVALQVGSKPVGRFPYQVCVTRRCMSNVDITPKMEKQFTQGKTANIFVAVTPQKNAKFQLDLTGFGKALASF